VSGIAIVQHGDHDYSMQTTICSYTVRRAKDAYVIRGVHYDHVFHMRHADYMILINDYIYILFLALQISNAVPSAISATAALLVCRSRYVGILLCYIA